MSLSRRALLAGAGALVALPARADALAALTEPGTHALMRHAIAPGTGDPRGFRLGDPSTQRLLSEEGREQARAAGRALRAAGIRFDRVMSSRWERCLETAALMEMGDVVPEPALDSFFDDRSTGPAQTAAVLALLSALPVGERVLMVTHQVNITALTGIVPRSGEIIAVRPEAGRAVPSGRDLLAG